MAMIRTHTAEPVFVSAVNARRVIKLRIGPSEKAAARIVELKPSEARKVALFLLTSAEKMEERRAGK